MWTPRVVAIMVPANGHGRGDRLNVAVGTSLSTISKRVTIACIPVFWKSQAAPHRVTQLNLSVLMRFGQVERIAGASPLTVSKHITVGFVPCILENLHRGEPE